MRVLIISNELPPFRGSGNIRVMNYINYLSELNNSIDVITVDYPKDSIAYDSSLENVFNSKVNLYRIKLSKLHKLFLTKKSKNNDKKNNKRNNKNLNIKKILSSFIKEHMLIPDQYMFWINKAFKKSKELINKNNYDLVLTIHERPSAHIVGLKIKQTYPSLKWCGYWSDPWSEDSLRNNRGFIKKKIENFYEKKIVENMDKLLFTTEKTKKIYKEKYSIADNKLDIVYRGYNILDYYEASKYKGKLPLLEKDKYNIVHLGTIYSELRDLNPLIEAVKILKLENKSIYDKLNIIFIGDFIGKDYKEIFDKYRVLKKYDAINFKDVIKYIENSECLLLYGNKNSSQVPGKVYEYLGSESPILTILGDEYDELEKIMKPLYKGPIILNEKQQIKNAIINLLNNKDEKYNRIDIFEWKNVAKDLQYKLEN
ncbi:hypothetical protein ACV3T9_10340 [Clostridium perfringens]